MVDPFGKKRETILVVDDSARVRNVVTTILEKASYRVLLAKSGANAIKVSEDFNGRIHLLVSDEQMPGMSGPDLGVALKLSRPDLQVMLMTAMADGDLLVPHYGWARIQKPFLTVKLLKIIDVVLIHSPLPEKSGTGAMPRSRTPILSRANYRGCCRQSVIVSVSRVGGIGCIR
jgi:DNA-binding NtrC family response regulator